MPSKKLLCRGALMFKYHEDGKTANPILTNSSMFSLPFADIHS